MKGLEKFDKNGGGRSIDGIPKTTENFLTLKEGVDYTTVLKNTAIESDHKYQEFAVFISPSLGEKEMEIEAPHWRTVSNKNILTILKNPYNNSEKDCFFEVNTKGVGYTKTKALGANIEDEDYWSAEDPSNDHDYGWKMFGLSSRLDYFLYKDQDIMDKSLFLNSRGLRTEVYWAVQKLEKIPYKGEMKTVRELKDLGVILDHRLYSPHMAERVMKTNSRIEELYKSSERREELYSKMFETYNKEAKLKGLEILDQNNKEDQKKFQKVFIKRMGNNLTVLFNAGYMHTALHSSNITLAAEIADIGPMIHISQDEKNKQGWNTIYKGLNYGHIKDIRDACYGVRYLRKSFSTMDKSRLDREEYFSILKNGVNEYLENNNDIPKERKEAFVWWIETISKKVFMESVNLPSFENGKAVSFKDWGIENID